MEQAEQALIEVATEDRVDRVATEDSVAGVVVGDNSTVIEVCPRYGCVDADVANESLGRPPSSGGGSAGPRGGNGTSSGTTNPGNTIGGKGI